MVDPCSKKSRSAWGLTLVLASPNGLVGGSRGSGGSGVGGSGGGCVEATCPAECDVTRFTLAVLSRRALGG